MYQEIPTPPTRVPIAVPVCKVCGEPPETGYTMLLCSDCRTGLARRKIPAWIVVSATVILIILAWSMVRVPAAISAGVAFQRGLDDERQGRYTDAEREYRAVVNAFPDSTEAMARLGIAACHVGDLRAAAVAFQSIEGKHASSETITEVHQAIKQMQDKP